jgi:D-arabinose 1-dehydrogenase-like Zn-dependent alcohol dehydrogenase
MRAMVLDRPGTPLKLENRPEPTAGPGQVLIHVLACGVCRTDLHVVDGELPQARYPIVPGHEIVGEVIGLAEGVTGFMPGERVGVPWLGSTCGHCRFCLSGQENLCDTPHFTGCDIAAELGAEWVGGSDETPPELLDAAVIFAPVGALVPAALRAVRKGGIVVAAGIHMSDIPSFPYDILWGERVVRSVANLTRADGEEFLALAAEAPIDTRTRVYPLERANVALDDLRAGRLSGAAVLAP